MSADSKDGGAVPAGSIEICSNCGQRFTAGQGHECTCLTVDYMEPSEAPPLPERAPDENGLVGRVLGNDQYLVLERISQGGMGVVYKARHKQLGSLVAVKVLHHADDPSFQQRFLREAQLAAKVKHPNIVYISDFGVLPDGGSFLVMEYLEGKTLTQAMSGFRLEVSRALRIATQLIRAVLAAHEQGIIHRDLKPANIFLVEKLGVPETVKIIDFGIAKGLPAEGVGVPPSGAWSMPHGQAESNLEDVHRTMSSLIGTPGFMAPEQIRSTLTDVRTDQYAIGCILYQMLTGTQVFSSATPQDLLLMHLVEKPDPPRKRLPELEISNELEGMILRMLAKEPEDRFPSLQDVEAELALELSLVEGAQAPSQSSFRSSGQNAISLRNPTPSQISSRPSIGEKGAAKSASQASSHPETTESTSLLPRRQRLLFALIGLAGLGLVGGGIAYRMLRAPQVVTSPIVTTESLQRLREHALAVLSEQTRHSDPQVRLGALSTLAEGRDGQALPILQGVYHGGSDVERAASLEAISQLRERQAVPLLQVALREAGAPAVKSAAAQALMALGEEGGVQFLEGELARGEKPAQLHAALLLCEHGHRQATERLSALLDDSKPFDAATLQALTCQARAGQAAAREKLATRLREAKSDADKLRVAARLHELGDVNADKLLHELAGRAGAQQLAAAVVLAAPTDPGGAELFRRVLRDANSDVAARQQALIGLGRSGELDDLKLIEPLLGAQTPIAVRQSAAGGALRLLGRDEKLMAAHSIAWARAAAGDANWLIRYAAVPLISENESPDTLPLLAQSLHDARPEVRLRAARVLGQRHDVEALRNLSTSLRDSDRAGRHAAARAIIHVAENAQHTTGFAPDATAWFHERLKSGSPEEQVLSHASLLRLGDAGQSAELAKLAANPTAEVRALIAESAGDDKVLLGKLLADKELEVRWPAAYRLALLGDRSGVPVLNEVLKRGGADAVRAYGALLRLGESANTPRELENLQSVAEVGARLVLIEDADALPRPEGVALLTQAERDPEPFARRLAAEVAAGITQGGPDSPLVGVLTRLSHDPMALVGVRAELLLSRILRGNAPIEKPPAPGN